MPASVPDKGSSPKVVLPPDARAEIGRIAVRAAGTGSLLMKFVTLVGGKIEGRIEALPDSAKRAIEEVTERALGAAYRGAEVASGNLRLPDMGRGGHRLAAAAAGAAGGAGGLATTLPEIMVTVPIIFAAIQKVARSEGFDPADEAVRRACLMVFAGGLPDDPRDDGVNASFLLTRMTISGATVQGLIARIAPRLAAALTQKLAAQTVPVLGAVTGAWINSAFLRYYQDVAEVRFALMRLERAHGEEAVRTAFRAALVDLRASGGPPR